MEPQDSFQSELWVPHLPSYCSWSPKCVWVCTTPQHVLTSKSFHSFLSAMNQALPAGSHVSIEWPFNGAGTTWYEQPDSLFAKAIELQNSFYFVSHTWDHPCSFDTDSYLSAIPCSLFVPLLHTKCKSWLVWDMRLLTLSYPTTSPSLQASSLKVSTLQSSPKRHLSIHALPACSMANACEPWQIMESSMLLETTLLKLSFLKTSTTQYPQILPVIFSVLPVFFSRLSLTNYR